MSETIKLDEAISIHADAVRCPCGGYAAQVGCTDEEIASDMNCGRSWACCVAAFVCSLCGKRLVASREAPEME